MVSAISCWLMPYAYMDRILSSMPLTSLERLEIACGSKEAFLSLESVSVPVVVCSLMPMVIGFITEVGIHFSLQHCLKHWPEYVFEYTVPYYKNKVRKFSYW